MQFRLLLKSSQLLLIFLLLQIPIPTVLAETLMEPTVKLYYPNNRAEVVDVRPFLELPAHRIINHLSAVQKQSPKQISILAKHLSLYATQQDYQKHKELLAELAPFEPSFAHGLFLKNDLQAIEWIVQNSETARLEIDGIEESCSDGTETSLAYVAVSHKNIQALAIMEEAGYRFVLGNAFCDILAKMGRKELYDEKVVDWFLSNVSGLERYQTDIYYGGNLLHWVVGYQVEANFINQLAKHGFDLSVVDSLGRTPLHSAINDGHADVLEALLNNGVDINARDADGKTAYDFLTEKDMISWTEEDLLEREDGWSDVRDYHQQYLDMQSVLLQYGAESNYGTIRWQVEPISYAIFLAVWLLIGIFSFICFKLANGFYAFWLSWVLRLAIISPLMVLFMSSSGFIADKALDEWVNYVFQLIPFIAFYGITSAAILGLAKWLHNQGAGKASIPARWIVSNENVPYIVYLRAFFTDASPEEKNHSAYLLLFAVLIAPLFLIFFLFRKTREESEVETLRQFGPVVGIGNPTEPLPLPGAYRLYVGTEGDWQSEVKNRLNGCSLCVIRMAETEGVTWEIINVLNKLPLNKILLIVSGKPDVQMRYRQQLQERMKDAGHEVDSTEWLLLEQRISASRGQTIYVGFEGKQLFHTFSLEILAEFLAQKRELYSNQYDDKPLQDLLNGETKEYFKAIEGNKLTQEEITAWTGR